MPDDAMIAEAGNKPMTNWSARDLQPLLGYSQCRRFENAIDRAKISCTQSGNDPAYHFAGAGKMVDLGSGSAREVTGNREVSGV